MSEEHSMGQVVPKVVTIGGGTGQFTLLSGLKKLPLALTAIVNMVDTGGSTGVLRDEMGSLPAGDLRQCLVALSEADQVMRELFTYRFENGSLKGHSFGNLFISTLEQVTGSLDQALERSADILKIKGHVLPVTLDDVHLVMTLNNGKELVGQYAVETYQLVSKFGVKEIKLDPSGVLNPKARMALSQADVVVVGPGNFYSSILPNFLVDGMAEALSASPAKKIFIANLMNRHGQTDDFTIGRYIEEIEKVIGAQVFDAVLYNTEIPPHELVTRYVDEGEPLVVTDDRLARVEYRGADLLAGQIGTQRQGDPIRRTLIRHDSFKLAQAIMEYIVEVT